MFESVSGSVYVNIRYHVPNCRDAIFCVSTVTNYANITFSAEKIRSNVKIFSATQIDCVVAYLLCIVNLPCGLSGGGDTRRKSNLKD